MIERLALKQEKFIERLETKKESVGSILIDIKDFIEKEMILVTREIIHEQEKLSAFTIQNLLKQVFGVMMTVGFLGMIIRFIKSLIA